MIATPLRAVAGTLAAMLPRRWWPRLDASVPASRAAWAASLLTLLAGAALFISGFLAYIDETAARNNALYVDAAARRRGGELPLPSGLSVLSLFTFVLLTPQGWASTYLVLSGLVRTIGSQFDDPHGDFILTLADAGVTKLARRTGRLRREGARRRREGPEVPDRVVRGSLVALPHVDTVIVASRVKPGWEVNAVVLSDRGEFRVVHVEDRQIGGHLRHLYALQPHRDLEAFRNAVRYQFPG